VISHADGLESFGFLVMSFEWMCSLRSRVFYPLSLALSRKGRGEVLIEYIERCLSGRGIKLFCSLRCLIH